MTSGEDEQNVTGASSEDDYNDTYDTDEMYDFYKVPQIVFVSVLCVFIIVGNSCVLAAIRLSQSGRKSRMNFFIMHLALADLLVGVMVSLTDLASKITIEWYAGNALCKIIQYSQAVVTYASTYMLVSLSIDRYDAVARPMNFSRSGYQGRFLVYTAWLVSFLFALPALFIYTETVQGGKKQCWLDFPEMWHWQLFFTAVAIVTFLMPAVIIASCYIAIIYIIWSKGQGHEPHCTAERMVLHQGGAGTPTRVAINDRRRETGRGIIPQAKIRTIKMTLIIVIVFILCWSPYFLYNLLELYQFIPFNNPVTTFIQSAAPLNSAANPIIYGIFSTRICKNLRRIPMPSCVREIVCFCKDTKRCNRLTFRGRNHKFMASQTTDPTLTTYEAHRRSNPCLNDIRLSPLKPSDRRCASLITKHLIDRAIFGETVGDILKRQNVDKKHRLFKISRNKWISDKIVCDYEMATLSMRGLARNIVSSGSDDSSATSDSNVRLPCSKRITEIKILSERNDQNLGVFTKKANESENINTFPCDLESSLIRHNKATTSDNKLSTQSADTSEKFNSKRNNKKSPARISDVNEKCGSSQIRNASGDCTVCIKSESSSDWSELDTPNRGQFSQLVLERDNLSRHKTTANSKINKSGVDGVESAATATPEGVTDKRLTKRRPSGVPTVRRRLTPEENAVLSHIAEKWLVSEVKAGESSVVQ